MDFLLRLRKYAVRTAAGLVVVSTTTSTVESYMGLRAWALAHGTLGAGSFIFPGMIDTFPLLGEIALFIGLLGNWRWTAKILPWAVITCGLLVSVGLNVGHLHSADIYTKITQGMPPVAAFMSLVVGIAMFELIMKHPVPEPEPVEDVAEDEPLDDVRQDQDEPPGDELEVQKTKVDAAIAAFEADLAVGRLPGLNRIRQTVHCGHKNAQLTQDRLKDLIESRSLELTS